MGFIDLTGLSMQLEFFDVPSPCIGVCQSNDKGQCLGCFRTRDERQTWINLTSYDKQKVIKRCQQRKKRKESGTKPKAIDADVVVEQPSSQNESLVQSDVKTNAKRSLKNNDALKNSLKNLSN
mgnify:CR=1 FL=1